MDRWHRILWHNNEVLMEKQCGCRHNTDFIVYSWTLRNFLLCLRSSLDYLLGHITIIIMNAYNLYHYQPHHLMILHHHIVLFIIILFIHLKGFIRVKVRTVNSFLCAFFWVVNVPRANMIEYTLLTLPDKIGVVVVIHWRVVGKYRSFFSMSMIGMKRVRCV